MRRKLALTLLVLVVIATLKSITEIRAAGPVVAVTSVYNVTELGKTFLVNITITGVTNLVTWVINLTWDPNIIKITTGNPDPKAWGDLRSGKYNIYEGPFLKTVRDTVFTAKRIENALGKIDTLACSYPAQGNAASGDGVLVTINFTSVKVGTTTIDIDGPSITYPGQSMIIHSAGKEILHEDRDGVVTEQGPPQSPIWTELWFQVTAVGIIVVAVVATAYVRLKKRARERPPEGEEIEGEEGTL